MITDALRAWVVHKYWSGDTSARVIFFTEEHGLIHGLWKGGRTPKKQALLQAFIPLWLVMDARGDAHFVRHLEVADTPLYPSGQGLFACLYVNELLHHALRPNDAHVTLHKSYQKTLEALSTSTERYFIEVVLRRFEQTLLMSCGYQMRFTHEAHSTKPIIDALYYRFIPGEGFVCAETGILGAHVIAIGEDRLDDVAVLRDAKRIMRCAIDHALEGKDIRARALYR